MNYPTVAGSHRTLVHTDVSGSIHKPQDSIGLSDIPGTDDNSMMMGDSIF